MLLLELVYCEGYLKLLKFPVHVFHIVLHSLNEL